MKSISLVAIIFAFLALLGTPAHAGGAWSGFYVGGNAGYAWGSDKSTLSITDGPTLLNCHFCNPSDIAAAASGGSISSSPDGFTGGGELGYNWQASNWVYGAEFDFEAFSQSQTANNNISLPVNPGGSTGCTVGVTPVPCVASFSTSVKTDWLLTIRPRIGYAWGQTLAYVTGGLAVTRLNFSQSYADNINWGASAGGSLTTSASKTRAGWVIGGGVEQGLGSHWSLKAEYLYVRFNGLNDNSTLTHAYPGGTDFANFSNNIDHLSSNIVRVGLNYRFGRP